MKKVVITGGAGFIGSQLGHQLHNLGSSVTLIDNLSYGYLDNLIIDNKLFGHFVCKDIRDNTLQVVFRNAETIYHFAGISSLPVCQSRPEMAFDVNVAGTANVLEAARRENVKRVIFASTSAVYEAAYAPVHNERDAVSPNLFYSLSKKAAEDICKAYSDNYGMDIIICRFFNVYGPHQDSKRVSPPFTSYIAKELATDQQAILFNKSTEARRDYIYVQDLISLLMSMDKSTKNYRSDIFNICSGVGYSVPELYEIMRRISGKEISPIYRDPMTYWDKYEDLFSGFRKLNTERISLEVFKNCVGDNKKARDEFDWRPNVKIEQGLENVYKFTKERH